MSVKLSFSNVRQINITDCEWKDLQTAILGGHSLYGCFDGATLGDFAPDHLSNRASIINEIAQKIGSDAWQTEYLSGKEDSVFKFIKSKLDNLSREK